MKLISTIQLIATFCLALLLTTPLSLFSQILIITHAYNRPEFVHLQAKTFKAFLKDDYKFVVFNDARDTTMREQIRKACEENDTQCINIPQNLHHDQTASRRHTTGIRYSLEVLGFNHNDIVSIIDSDMFLIREFSIRDFLGTFHIAGLDQSREYIHYIWPGLVFINMPLLPNKKTLSFDCGTINGIGVDTGGYTYHYLHNNPSVTFKKMSQIYPDKLPKIKDDLTTLNLTPSLINFIIEIPFPMRFEILADNAFLHYGIGTNWANQTLNYQEQKTTYIQNFIEKIIEKERLN